MTGIAADVRELIQYRNLIKQLTVRDLKLRYERSILGFIWSLLNPLIMIIIYSIFFSHVVRMGIDKYPAFLVTVLLPWNFVSRGLLGISLLPYSNGYLLNRAYFPSESLIFSGMLSSFIDFCLEMVILVIVLAIFGTSFMPGILVIPLAMLILFFFTSGIALFFAVFQVFYRDTQYIIGILATVWMYMSPVFYPVSIIPEPYQAWYNLNPMVHIGGLFRTALYDGKLPNMQSILISMLIAAGMFLIGWTFFNKHKRSFAEMM